MTKHLAQHLERQFTNPRVWIAQQCQHNSEHSPKHLRPHVRIALTGNLEEPLQGAFRILDEQIAATISIITDIRKIKGEVTHNDERLRTLLSATESESARIAARRSVEL